MLPRVLEPELMDTAEEAHDYDTMDHTAVNQRFVADFLLAWDGQGPVVDVGTGTAQIPIALCQAHPDVDVVAVDAAAHMIRVAEANVERAGLGKRIRLQLVDGKRMPFADREFGAVISNSIVHHIPEPRFVIQEMVRVLKPGGWLFVRNLVRPKDDASVAHLVQTYAGDANQHQRQMFDDSLRAALTVAEIRELVRVVGFTADSVQPTSDRHWTWAATRST